MSLPTTSLPSKFYKYLPQQAFNMSNRTASINLKKLNIKRIHIRKFIETPRKNQPTANSLEPHTRINKVVLKRKLFKGLTYLQLHSLFHPYWIEEFKKSKNLVKFNCQPDSSYSLFKHVILFLHKINKNLQTLDFTCQFGDHISNHEIKAMYKKIRKFSQLKAFQGHRDRVRSAVLYRRSYHQAQMEVQEDFLSLYQCVKRLEKLENFEWRFLSVGHQSLNNLPLTTKKLYQKVTNHTINISQFLIELEQKEEVVKYEGSFPFESFSNLKELHFNAGNYLLGCPHFHNPHIFANLKSLQKLDLKLTDQAEGIEFIFESLIQLPPLKFFSLDIDLMDERDWKQLIAFMQKQPELISIELKFLLSWQEEKKQAIEDFLASLNNKPKLQYLVLKANYWPLQNLSNGLKRLKASDQIKVFELQASGYFFTDPEKVENYFAGLCEFLLRNKKTLYSLKLDVPFSDQQERNDELASAVSQLSQLEILSWRIVINFLENGDGNGGTALHKRTFAEMGPRLSFILPRLQKLQDLNLGFQLVEKACLDFRGYVMETFDIFPLLKRLKTLELVLPPEGISEEDIERINLILKSRLWIDSMVLKETSEEILNIIKVLNDCE